MNEYQIEQPGKSGKRIGLLFIGLLGVAFLIGLIYFQTKINASATSESRAMDFTIEKGMSTRQIAESLEDKKIINNPTIFIVYVYLNNAKSKMQAGDYILDSNMAITEIVDILTRGAVVSKGRKVTIVEGLSNRQIVNYLDSREIVSSPEDFNKAIMADDFDFKFEELGKLFSYQGFLFPDTYILAKEGKADELISKMLNNFESKITDKMLADIEAKNRKFSDVLILASIIEKEVGRNKQTLTDKDIETMQEERELVASVFYNRLEIGMALESDATVNYITGKSDRSATIEDTKIKSPYNTYQNRGLPPTPISNPGIDAIRAAIYPAESDYLYFLNSPDGTAYFAKTLAEHGQNREKYLR